MKKYIGWVFVFVTTLTTAGAFAAYYDDEYEDSESAPNVDDQVEVVINMEEIIDDDDLDDLDDYEDDE